MSKVYSEQLKTKEQQQPTVLNTMQILIAVCLFTRTTPLGGSSQNVTSVHYLDGLTLEDATRLALYSFQQHAIETEFTIAEVQHILLDADTKESKLLGVFHPQNTKYHVATHVERQR